MMVSPWSSLLPSKDRVPSTVSRVMFQPQPHKPSLPLPGGPPCPFLSLTSCPQHLMQPPRLNADAVGRAENKAGCVLCRFLTVQVAGPRRCEAVSPGEKVISSRLLSQISPQTPASPPPRGVLGFIPVPSASLGESRLLWSARWVSEKPRCQGTY